MGPGPRARLISGCLPLGTRLFPITWVGLTKLRASLGLGFLMYTMNTLSLTSDFQVFFKDTELIKPYIQIKSHTRNPHVRPVRAEAL